MPFERSSGLLLHVTSLPSAGGIGDLGPAAYAFANFLASAGQRIWQVLPLNPTGYGNSPYGALSAFAGNPLLVSLDVMANWGWIGRERLESLSAHVGAVDFEEVVRTKQPLLEEAAGNFLSAHEGAIALAQWERFEEYCRRQQTWLGRLRRVCGVTRAVRKPALDRVAEGVCVSGWGSDAALAGRERERASRCEGDPVRV